MKNKVKSGLVLVLALGLLSAAAGGAEASTKGVYDTFGGTGATGGSFLNNGINVGTVAVNSTGAGGANPGDLYIADRANRRIQRFDADGNFIAAWGADVEAGGATGYEVCTVAANCKAGLATTGSPAVATGGAMNDPRAVAVNQTTGEVYVTERSSSRVEEFSATGTWIRAFGKDVVCAPSATCSASAAEQADEVQRLTVDAGAGNYRLTFGAATTADIEWSEPAAGVQAKLNALSTIGGAGGSVAVSGGAGAPGGASPYRIEFGGTLANTNQAALAVAAGTTPLSGGGAAATIATLNDGAVGFEVCETMAVCKAGANATTGGAFDNVGTESLAGVAVAPVGAPNAGDVLVADGSGNSQRAQEFTASGAFQRAFGWDVVASGPDDTAPVNQFEVCRATALDICKKGASGAGTGQFEQGPGGIAEDSSGNLYTVESKNNFRLQRFALTGSSVTPQGPLDPTQLTGSAGNQPVAVAVDTATATGTPGTVYLLKYFPAGTGSPPAVRREARVLEVDPTANGGEGEAKDTFAPLGEIGAASGELLAAGLGLNTANGRLYTTEAQGGGSNSVDRAFVHIIDPVPPLTVNNVQATDLGSSSATLRASITPAPLPHLHTLYRFEYARAGTAGSCGEGAAGWTRAPLLEADAGNGLAAVPVAQQVSGLKFEKTYEFCLRARTQFNGSIVNVGGGSFTTLPAAPVAVTGPASWSSPPASGPSLLLTGTVNPGSRATYYFEYASAEQFAAQGFEGAARAPEVPAEAGEGTEPIPVVASIAGLDPSKTYYYRLLATNVTGSDGLDPADIRTVAPPSPGDRFYELVSPGDSWGSGISGLDSVAAGGDRASFGAQAFGQPSSLSGPSSTFVSERGPGGWEVGSMAPDADSASPALATPHLLAADLGSELWPESSFAAISRGETSFGLVHLDGSRENVLGPLAPVTLSGTFREFKLLGATQDLSHAVFGTRLVQGALGATFLTGERLLGSGNTTSNLYEIAPSGGGGAELRIVNRGGPVTPANPLGVIGGRCGAGLGGNLVGEFGSEYRAISADGAVIYFTARPGEVAEGECKNSAIPKRIFKRINGETTVEVSAPACTPTPACPGSPAGDDSYQGASAEGRVVLFTTNRRLVNSDADTTNDLYLYDASPPAGQPQLVQASAGETVGSHVAGSGAKVLGVLDGSGDGSRAYFTAEGVLSGPDKEGKAPFAGKPNLYVYQRDGAHPGGRIAFVGTLDPTGRPIGVAGDPALSELIGIEQEKQAYALPGGAGGDGRYLLFTSFAKLSGEDGDEAKDVYRYDDQEEALLCLSCAGNGPFDANISPRLLKSVPAAAVKAPPASADVGTVAFTTAEAILPDDRNEGHNLTCPENSNDVTGCDVYAWHEGALSLISGGTGALGINRTGTAGVSPSGRDVFFTTSAPLVASDANNANDLYDARVGGGFPVAGRQALCAGNEECQGPSPATPAATQPGSATFAGPGNPPAPAVSCPKGKVKRHGRCVARHRHRHQHPKHHRDAGTKKKGGGR